jgi:hypothetical protein
MVVDEFDELRESAGDQPLVMSVVLHSFITGAPFRFRRVHRALQHLAAFDDVWLTTPGPIAAAFAELSPPPAS